MKTILLKLPIIFMFILNSVSLPQFPQKKEDVKPIIQQDKTIQPIQEKTITQETLPSKQPQEIFSYQMFREKMLLLINNERDNPVILYDPLLKSTTLRAQEANQYWSHTRPNGLHWNTILSSIIDINKVHHGENLAKTTIPYQGVFQENDIDHIVSLLHQGLINSPTHYHVLTNNTYKKMNIGIYIENTNNQYSITIAQHFIE